jgi:hypothetical protein
MSGWITSDGELNLDGWDALLDTLELELKDLSFEATPYGNGMKDGVIVDFGSFGPVLLVPYLSDDDEQET